MADITINNLAIFAVENRTQQNIPLYTQMTFQPVENLTINWPSYQTYSQVEIVYVDNTGTEQRIILPSSELPRIRIGTSPAGVNQAVQMRSSVFGQYLNHMSRMKQLIVTAADTNRYILNFYEVRRVYLENPTTVAFETMRPYLRNRSITVIAQQAELGEILIGVTHNIPTSAYNLVIEDVQGITGKNPADFPFYFRELSENVEIEGTLINGTDFQVDFILGPPLTRTFEHRVTATKTGDPIIPQPEGPPIIPERDRYTLGNFRFDTTLSRLLCSIFAIPPLDFDDLIRVEMQRSRFATFASSTFRRYTSPSTTGYQFPELSQGANFVRAEIRTNDGSDIYTPVYLVTLDGTSIKVATAGDIQGLLSKTKIFTDNINSFVINFRLENEIFLQPDITQVTIRVYSDTFSRTATITNDATKSYLSEFVQGLSANTLYNVQVKATYSSLSLVVADFQVKTAIASNTTEEQLRAQAVDIAIKENLDVHDSGLVEKFSLADKTEVAKMIEANKVLVPDLEGNVDKNPNNKFGNRYNSKANTQFSTETTLTIEDRLADIAETIPEPNEDTDLLQEPY